MTSAEFRQLALSFPETVASVHMGHPDFRVGGKIFATLGYPDNRWGMVKLTPEQQEMFVTSEPAAFIPVKGAWGLRGSTHVHLRAAKKPSVRSALTEAWRNTAPPRLAKQFLTS